MSNLTTGCEKCDKENAYFDGYRWVCPDCGHEWDAR